MVLNTAPSLTPICFSPSRCRDGSVHVKGDTQNSHQSNVGYVTSCNPLSQACHQIPFYFWTGKCLLKQVYGFQLLTDVKSWHKILLLYCRFWILWIPCPSVTFWFCQDTSTLHQTKWWVAILQDSTVALKPPDSVLWYRINIYWLTGVDWSWRYFHLNWSFLFFTGPDLSTHQTDHDENSLCLISNGHRHRSQYGHRYGSK